MGTINTIITDKNDLKTQIAPVADVVPLVKRFSNNITTKNHSVKVTQGDYDTTKNIMIWGHPTLGLWGDFNWGTHEDAFTETDYAILPNNNEFIEYFFNTTYIDLDNSDVFNYGVMESNTSTIPLTQNISFGGVGDVLQ